MKLLNINGFNVFHIPTKSNIVSVRVVVYAGSANEQPKQYGSAHMLEHIFFKGTKTKDYAEINNIASSLGDINAYTNHDKTTFLIDTINSKWSDAIDLLIEMLFEPRFDPKELEKERKVILEEYQTSKDDPSSFFWQKAVNIAMGELAHPIIGEAKTIKSIQIDDLKQFKRNNYCKNNMLFIISGNVEEKQIINHLTPLLLQKINNKSIGREKSKLAFNNKPINFSNKAEQAYIAMFYAASEDKNKKQNTIQDVFVNAFGNGMHSLLFHKIREELGLCYHIGAYQVGFDELKSIVVYSQLNKKNLNLIQDCVRNTIESVRKEGFDERRLETSKTNIVYRIARGTETAAGIASFVGENYLNSKKYYSDKELTPDAIIKDTMKITNKDIIEYVNWWVPHGNSVVTMNG